MRSQRILALFLGTFLVACAADMPAQPEPVASSSTASSSSAASRSTTAPTQPAQKVALTETKFGAPITEATDTSLADIAKAPERFSDKTVRTSGVVQSVCQSAGCWMEIGDPEQRAHIKMAGHAFLVPKNCAGHRAVVQGTVKASAPQNECGKKDGCGGEENGAVAKLEIVATGVEFVD